MLDYSVDDGQAQAGSFARFLGGEKGLKNVGLNLAAHSNTGITDGEDHILARRDLGMASGKNFLKFDVSGLDGQPAALGHGIARIYRQVQDHLFHLSGIGLDAIG